MNSSRSASSSICTTNPAKPSSAPTAIADPGGTPWSWKNRMLTAMRAAMVGMAMLMYEMASCRA